MKQIKFKTTANIVDVWHANLRNGRAIISTVSVKRMNQAVIRNRRCMGIRH